jgi:hypothetical protein
MIIFNFRSEGGQALFAFAADRQGGSLPARHGPWKLIEDIAPEKKMPHAFDRKAVERAIDEHGFQLWRLKKDIKSARHAPRPHGAAE